MLPQRIGIIGLGLIGGSLARALKQAQPELSIAACDTDVRSLDVARGQGMIDASSDTVEALAERSQLVVIATPVRAIAGLADRLLSHDQQVLVTDTGSVKASVLAAMKTPAKARRRFVPGHPVAGSERFGVDAADAALFQGRRVILTPTSETGAEATAAARSLWETAGAAVENMSPQHHDEVLAATSHLPHVLAYALVDCLAGLEDRREIFAYAAGGFRDFTRIASSSPEMWRDIFLENREAIAEVLEAFETTLGQLRAALQEADDARVLATLMRSRAARQRFLQLMEGAP